MTWVIDIPYAIWWICNDCSQQFRDWGEERCPVCGSIDVEKQIEEDQDDIRRIP